MWGVFPSGIQPLDGCGVFSHPVSNPWRMWGVFPSGIQSLGCFPTAQCLQPMDEGSCQHHSLLWYFHSPTNSCRPFLFGGCRGNGNRFPSRRECQRRCQSPTGETPNPPFVQP
uniref:BPTI/Kunitz inhibitor domain-containing protein n=1 Tax=Zosterops lateralis melanops TaxID=1220523 RepID=A0A8D2P8G0_ZOSLA